MLSKKLHRKLIYLFYDCLFVITFMLFSTNDLQLISRLE